MTLNAHLQFVAHPTPRAAYPVHTIPYYSPIPIFAIFRQPISRNTFSTSRLTESQSRAK